MKNKSPLFRACQTKNIVFSFVFLFYLPFQGFSQTQTPYNLTQDQVTTISIIGNYCNFIINQADRSFDYQTVVNGWFQEELGKYDDDTKRIDNLINGSPENHALMNSFNNFIGHSKLKARERGLATKPSPFNAKDIVPVLKFAIPAILEVVYADGNLDPVTQKEIEDFAKAKLALSRNNNIPGSFANGWLANDVGVVAKEAYDNLEANRKDITSRNGKLIMKLLENFYRQIYNANFVNLQGENVGLSPNWLASYEALMKTTKESLYKLLGEGKYANHIAN